MYTPLFIAFRGVCCSISQREYQRHEKIALKLFILNNRVKLDYEFGSFLFTVLFFSQKEFVVAIAIATLFTNQISFDLCYFAPAERQNKIWRYSKKMKKVVYSIKKVRGNSDDKISGLGFLNEEGTLLISIIEQLNL